jgi:DNA-directed RNA polymerase subunit RPC12/RpoP
MRFKDDHKQSSRRKHSSPNRAPYLGTESRNGAPIRCQYCTGQSFRRSSLRSQDLTEILLMRYPVRCLRCSQRQLVSFTVASLSISSSIKIKKRGSRNSLPVQWKDPFKDRSGDQPRATVSTPPDR